MLVDLYRQGRLDFDVFVSEEIKLDEVESRSSECTAARYPARWWSCDGSG
jgi:Zn-dependent alcohol dehydrogenase